jgi:hypothetical protein
MPTKWVKRVCGTLHPATANNQGPKLPASGFQSQFDGHCHYTFPDRREQAAIDKHFVKNGAELV